MSSNNHSAWSICCIRHHRQHYSSQSFIITFCNREHCAQLVFYAIYQPACSLCQVKTLCPAYSHSSMLFCRDQFSDPFSFTLYTIPLSDLIPCYSSPPFMLMTRKSILASPLTLLQAVYSPCNSVFSAFSIQKWMTENKLKLNPDKTEFLVIFTPTIKDRLSELFSADMLGAP